MRKYFGRAWQPVRPLQPRRILIRRAPPLQCMSGMLDMLEDGADVTMPGEAFVVGPEDPDAVLTGVAGSGVSVDGGRAAGGGPSGGGGRYSELLPHLLDLVSYQSGVEAVEVCVS